MSLDPVKIPQNVYIEDRIVGPLTLKQTILITLGGGFSYALQATLQKTYGGLSIPTMIMVWVPCGIAALFALVKINDLSLLRICLLLIERLNKESVRTWGPRGGISITLRTTSKPNEKDAAKDAPVRSAQHDIGALSSAVDGAFARVPEPAVTAFVPAAREPSVPEDVRPSIDEPQFLLPEENPAVGRRASSTPPLSDLSVFRDIVPPSASPSMQ